MRRGSPGDFTCDSYCTSAKVLHHLHREHRAYGGDVQLNRKVVYAGREQKLQEGVRQMAWEAQKPVRVGSRR